MKQNKQIEKAIKKRYNRDIKAYREVEKLDDTVIAIVKLIYKDNEFILKDYMEEGATVYATVKHNDKRNKYNSYLKAEIKCMDLIGEM